MRPRRQGPITYEVFAAPPPDIFTPPYTVILSGTIDVANGVISNPALQVNVYPGETFSVMQDTQHILITRGNQIIDTNLWLFDVGDPQNQNLQLFVDFKPLTGETLDTFTGGVV